MKTLLASLALALLVLTPKPLVRWPATDAPTKVVQVQVSDICLACLPHHNGSQWV